MLPVPILDNEQFNDIMDEARNMIVSLYPEWTDFNYHDPGITLIEMFAWLKENQQYHLDQISEKSRERYLKLLGERRLRKAPSFAVIDVEPLGDVGVLAGTKLYAGQVCFMTDERKQLVHKDASSWFFARDQIEQIVERTDQGQRASAVAMFGQNPRAGDCFYIRFENALPHGERLSLYIELAWAGKTERNQGADKMAVPMAELTMEYYSENGWRTVAEFEDRTFGAIESGLLRFLLDDVHTEAELFGVDGYFLRIVLKSHEYDVPPLIESVSINRFTARQRDGIIEQIVIEHEYKENRKGIIRTETMGALNGGSDLFVCSEGRIYQVSSYIKSPDYDTGVCTFEFETPEGARNIDSVRVISNRDGGRGGMVLGEGTGFPFQEYSLNDINVEYESFEIMVREPVKLGEYLEWTKVDDFSKSLPGDRHYILDSLNGVVRFGDCFRGMAPEGEIVITSYVRTLGRAGDVTARKINRFDGMEPEDTTVYNRYASQGGRDEEELADSFSRVAAKLSRPFIAVSDKDYEQKIMETPGLVIESCKVITAEQIRRMQKNLVDELAINIVVKPGGGNGLSACYRKNILAHIEKHRTAGRRINLLATSRIMFEVFGDIVLSPHYMQARETVWLAVKNFFDRLGGMFGVTVSYSELYGVVDGLPCVARINSLNMDAKGSGVIWGDDGAVTLPPNGVAELGDAQYLFSIGG